MAYSVELKPSAAKDLASLPKDVQRRLSRKIDSLSFNPRPPGCEKIKGEDDIFRVRLGDYRLVYLIFERRLLILIVKIGHRKDVYRGM